MEDRETQDEETGEMYNGDTGEIIEPVITMLEEMHQGSFARELSSKLKELVNEIMKQHLNENTKKSGSLNIKIRLETTDLEYTPFKVYGDCEIKKPKTSKVASLFYPTTSGALSRNHQHQIGMFDNQNNNEKE